MNIPLLWLLIYLLTVLLLSSSHKYLSLPLVPVEEFLALFPEHTDSDAHELMIARINHEHAEREKLEQARQELLKRKQALIAENKKRKDDLANLDQDLERFIDVRYSFWTLCYLLFWEANIISV
jgi:Fms-interacting protein/Thoc5